MYQGKTITAAVQAHLESTPRAGGALTSLAGRPVIWHVVRRLEAVEAVDRIVVATTTASRDDPLASYIDHLDSPDVDLFRGPTDDPLGRCYLALQDEPTDLVVDVTDDAVLVSRSHLQTMIAHLVDRRLDVVGADFDHTGLTPGLGTDVYHHQAIVDAHLLAAASEDRRDVGRFVRRHDRAFRVDYPSPPPELCSEFRLTMQTPDDYRLIARLYRRLYRPGRLIDCRRALGWLRDHPEAAGLNRGVQTAGGSEPQRG